MATTYTKALLSQSTNGKALKVTGTDANGAITIHTAVASVTDLDVITLFAYNHDTTTRVLTIMKGGTASPDDYMLVSIPAQSGWYTVMNKQLINNSLVIKAFASAANVVTIDGFVDQIRTTA